MFVVVIATTATTFTRHHVESALDFFIGSLTCFHHCAFIVQCFASQWMIQVENHEVFFDFEHKTIEAEAIFIDEWEHSSWINSIGVKATIDNEGLFGHFNHMFFLVRAIGFLYTQRKLESIAFVEVCHLTFKGFQSHAQARNKLKWVLRWGFFNDFADACFIVCEELIGNSNITIGHLGCVSCVL